MHMYNIRYIYTPICIYIYIYIYTERERCISILFQVVLFYEGPLAGHKLHITAEGITIGRRHNNNLVLMQESGSHIYIYIYIHIRICDISSHIYIYICTYVHIYIYIYKNLSL